MATKSFEAVLTAVVPTPCTASGVLPPSHGWTGIVKAAVPTVEAVLVLPVGGADRDRPVMVQASASPALAYLDL